MEDRVCLAGVVFLGSGLLSAYKGLTCQEAQDSSVVSNIYFLLSDPALDIVSYNGAEIHFSKCLFYRHSLFYFRLLTPPGTPLFPSLEMESRKSYMNDAEAAKPQPTVLRSRVRDMILYIRCRIVPSMV